MKNLAVFSSKLIFLILASLGKPRQSIYSRICLSLVIINLEIVLRELLNLTDLSGAQTLSIYEATEVAVICEDKNLMFVIL